MVVILAGKDKGKEGRILQVLKAKGRVLVEGINQVKRHQKPNQQMQKGGIVEKEASVHISNVQVVTDGKRTRVKRIRNAEGKTVRTAVASGEQLDKS
jgi:large subunit ribosomal protein L24